MTWVWTSTRPLQADWSASMVVAPYTAMAGDFHYGRYYAYIIQDMHTQCFRSHLGWLEKYLHASRTDVGMQQGSDRRGSIRGAAACSGCGRGRRRGSGL